MGKNKNKEKQNEENEEEIKEKQKKAIQKQKEELEELNSTADAKILTKTIQISKQKKIKVITLYTIEIGRDRPIRLSDKFTPKQKNDGLAGIVPMNCVIELPIEEAMQLARIEAVKILDKNKQSEVEGEIQKEKDDDIPTTPIKHLPPDEENS